MTSVLEGQGMEKVAEDYLRTLTQQLRILSRAPVKQLNINKSASPQHQFPQLIFISPPGMLITYFNPHFVLEEPATTLCGRFTGIRSVN